MMRNVNMIRGVMAKSRVNMFGQQTRVQSAVAGAKQVNTALSMPASAKQVTSGSNAGFASVVGSSFQQAPQAGIRSFNASPLTPQGLGVRGFVNHRRSVPMGTRGFATSPAMKTTERKIGTLNLSDYGGVSLSREARRAAMEAQAITADAIPEAQRRLFGHLKPFGDDPKVRSYRMGGLAVFCGFLAIIHPWFSMNWLKMYRAYKIKQEEGDYKAYFGDAVKTTAMIQDEVAGRHKTHTKFRVLKNLDTEGKMIHRQRGGTPQMGKGNASMGKFT